MSRCSWIGLAVLAAIAAGTSLVARASETTPLTVVAIGDPRFTDPANLKSSNPNARAALVGRIAAESPDAVLIAGDLPWHGGDTGDYDRFRAETTSWRSRRLLLIPALGNHEFSQCDEEACLEHWWQAFPDLRGKRWYARTIADQVEVLALDTMSPLIPGSEQRTWLEGQIGALPGSVKFVILLMHHPAVADVQTRLHVDHNPRPNEVTLADYLARVVPTSRARFMVVTGHIHNYERLAQDGVMYVTSGGGGATPYPVERTPPDLFQQPDFPNYHFVKMTIGGDTLKGEMFRLDEPDAPQPHFTVKDSFELTIPR
jgi:hypothetical protein